jgi:sulfonate transport system substrate-binding protein
VAAIEAQSKVRRLPDAEGVANYQRYYLASATFAKDRKDALAAIFELLRTTGGWVKQNPADAAKLLAPIWGLPEAVVTAANARRSYDVRAVTPADLSEQQTIADVFFAEGLLTRAVKAADAAIFVVG